MKLSLKERIRLMEKYDFSMSSEGLSDDGEKNYLYGFGNRVSSLTLAADGVQGGSTHLKDDLGRMYGEYGFIAVCYSSINPDEIEGNADFDVVREIKAQIPIIGANIHALANAAAFSQYQDNEEVQQAAEKLRESVVRVQRRMRVYRDHLRDLKKELESQGGKNDS